jgi:tRNA(Ile)-lysidine synthase
VERATRRPPAGFGPRWLQQRLSALLPQFPQVPVCVAFSGGADSTALLAALARLPRPPLKLRALHVDHRLHPDSRRWSAHCRRVAHALGVPLIVRTVAAARRRGESPEAAARAARYRLLGTALADREALLMAHHQDDQLETVLLQLLRGAGVAGLAAMPAAQPFARGLLVRPLLPLPRSALRAWLSRQGIGWIEDDSNAEQRFDRNYLRARVLPLIRARWPSAAATAGRSARHAAEAQRLLDMLGEADAGRARCGAMLSAKVLRRLPPERRRNALRFWIGAAGCLAPPTSRLAEIAGPLLAARPDAHPLVAWEGAAVERHADLLSLRTAHATAAPGGAGLRAIRLREAAAPRGRGRAAPAPGRSAGGADELAWDWRARRTCRLPPPGGTLTLRPDARGPLDLDALAPRLSVRTRRGGERLRPVRGGPRRTLKSLLQQARMPPAQRALLPLIFAGERLIAAADLWLDESVQAHASSARRGRLVWRAHR